MDSGMMDKETRKKIRFLENRGWYKDICGNYSHMAYIGLTYPVAEIQRMDWKGLHTLESKLKKFEDYNSDI